MGPIQAQIVVGLGFGDEGKGTTVDFLARQHSRPLIVKFTGSHQAAHNVVDERGRAFCFSQFGAGMLVPGAETHIDSGALVELEALAREAEFLEKMGVQDPLSKMSIHPGCILVLPWHKLINRIREMSRGARPFGSCGCGVGEAVRQAQLGHAMNIYDTREKKFGSRLQAQAERLYGIAAELMGNHPSKEMKECFYYFLERSPASVCQKYREVMRRLQLKQTRTRFSEARSDGQHIIFEGAQGALLDYRHGFFPYVTKTRTTVDVAEKVLKDADLSDNQIQRIGVMRAYGHRHGAGPFITEDVSLDGALSDQRNPTNRWQGAFRVGWFDLVAIRYGLLTAESLDVISLTGLDRLSGMKTVRVGTSYSYHGKEESLLSRYFSWDRPSGIAGSAIRIKAFYPPENDRPPEDSTLARLLADCTPFEWREFPGWSELIDQVRRFEDLPANAQAYVNFLEEALNTSISIISVGERSDQKICR